MTQSASLQAVVRARLLAVSAVTALVGQRVYDRPVKGVAFPYVTFGPSDYVPGDHACLRTQVETMQIDVWSNATDGKAQCKQIVNAISVALHRHSDAAVAGLAIAGMRVVQVRVMDDPDPRITHGVVTLETVLEY